MNKDFKNSLGILGLTVLTGTLVKLPEFFPKLNRLDYYPGNVPLIILTALAGAFMLQGKINKKSSYILFSVIALSFGFINLFPGSLSSQTGFLSVLNLPIFIWLMTGFLFRGKDPMESRMTYIRFNGELLMVIPLLLIGGMVFSGMMSGVFNLIDIRIERFIAQYVAVYGSIGSILVASVLVEKLLKNYKALAPIIAQLFTPLFLVFLLIFLIVAIIDHKNPYLDRDSLLVFNTLMIMVLGMVVFSISGRHVNRWTALLDWINVTLTGLTLVVNSIALSAILFRLTAYGMSPNRMAVLGTNIVIFVHLSGIAIHQVKVLRNSSTIHAMEKWVCKYWPVYLVWTGFVTFGFPFIFIKFQ